MGVILLEFVVLAVLAASHTLSAADCGESFTNQTGTVVSQDPGQGKKCTWHIISNDTKAQVMLDFGVLTLVPGSDNLIIYGGNSTNITNSTVVANFTSHQGPEMVISPGNITIIVLTRGNDDKMTAQFSLTYNTKNCSHSVTGRQNIIKSPIYLSGTGALTCTYDIAVPGDVPVLSFPQFNLPDGSLTVKYNNDSATTFKGTKRPDDLVWSAGQGKISLTLSIQNASSVQNFTAEYQTASAACSGAFTADNNKANVTLPSYTSFSTMCYMKFTAKDNDSHVYLNLAAQTMMGGVDSLVLYDGGSVFGQQIGSSSRGPSWYVSSGASLTAVATLGSQSSRSGQVSYKQDKFSQLYLLNSTGQPQSATLNGKDVNNQTVYLQFMASNMSSQVQVAVDSSSKLTTTVIWVQDTSGISLITFGPGTAIFPVTVQGGRALVLVSDLAGNDSAKITASSVMSGGCNQLYPGDSGVITANSTSTNTSCTVAVTSAKPTLLRINSLGLCKGQKMSVYAGLGASATKLATLSGSSGALTQIHFPVSGAPRLQWDNTEKAEGCSNPLLSANYLSQEANALCGTLSPNSITGSANSPGFPNQYPLNLMCSWDFPQLNNSLLYLAFKTVDLTEKHSVVVKKNKTTDLFVLNSNTTTLPNDQLFANTNLSMTFSSAVTNGDKLEKTGQGFALDYRVLSCGGFLTSNSSNISSPAVNKTTECIWIIQVQPTGANKSVNVVSVNISISNWKNESSGMLQLHDGGSMRDPQISLNLTRPNVAAYSRHNIMMVHYTYNMLQGGAKPNPKALAQMTFKLTYTTYNCNVSSQCANGDCMLPGWLCDGKIQCADGSDELHCNCTPPATTTAGPPVTPQPRKAGKSVNAAVVVISLLVGLVVGVILTLLVPRIIRKWRLRNYANSGSNYGTLSEDA